MVVAGGSVQLLFVRFSPGSAAKGRLANGAGTAGTVSPHQRPFHQAHHRARRRRDAKAARCSILSPQHFAPVPRRTASATASETV